MDNMLKLILWISYISVNVTGQQHITQAACSQATRPVKVTDSSVTLLSPNYPGYYDDNELCDWRLKPGVGRTSMYLNFEEFDTELGWDYVTIYNSQGELLLRLSGTSPAGERFVFHDSEIRVVFDSDSIVSRPGFRIVFGAIEVDSRADVACNPLTLPAEISSSTASLQPLGGRDREYCFWIFTAELGPDDDTDGVYVALNDFDNLEDGQLAVYSGRGKEGEVLFVYDDSMQENTLLWVRDTVVSVEYSSILDNNAYFNLTIFPQDGACASGTAREIFMPSGSAALQSPGYPYTLPNYLSCNWVISTYPGQTITVLSAELDIDSDPYCERDYVEVMDGADSRAPSFGRFCNAETFHVLTSTSNSLQIILRSDEALPQKRGFNLIYVINGDSGGDGSGDDGEFPSGDDDEFTTEVPVTQYDVTDDPDIASQYDYMFDDDYLFS